MASIKDYDILLREKTDSELRNYFPITKTDNVMVSTDKSLTTYLKELELMHYKYDLGLKKLNNIEDLAEVNQNAYSKVKFGFKSVSAKNKTDTLSLSAGENISIDSDENDNIVISSTYHEVPMADEFQAGKMSRADYIKLQGIESYANNYIHPKSGVVAGLYSYIRVDDKGHIIEGVNDPVPVELGGTGVKSYTELGEKLNLDALVKVDNTVIATGKNPVSGSAVYDALLSKAEKNHGLHVPDTSITTSDGITFLANNNTWQSVRSASITQSGVIRLTSNYDDVIDGRVLTPEAVRQGDAEVKSYVDKKFSDLIGGAPETLDTIYELASAAEQHEELLTRVDSAIGKKVDKVDGKGLSTNDYTTEDKNIVNRANTHMSNTSNPHNVTKTQIGLSDVTNDKQVKGLSSGTTEDNVVVFGADGYSIKNSGHTIKSNVPENAKFTDTIYTMSVATDTNKYPFVKLIDSSGREVGFSIYGDDRLSVSKDAYGNIKIDASGIKYNEASESGSGFMSKSDYIKLKGIEEGANKYVHPTSGVVVGTYLKVSVDKYGHVISGSNEVIAVSEGGTGANNAKDALVNLGIKSTATEINYLSGVTANIQDQLSYKVSTDTFSKHTHPQYSTTDHTHSIYSTTTHTHSQYSLTSHTHTYLPLSGGTLTGTVTCNSTITFGADDEYGIRTASNNTGSIGDSTKYFSDSYINNMHANRLGLNSGASSTASYIGTIYCNTLTEHRQYSLPDSDGQIALTHQLSIYSTTAHTHSQYSLTSHSHSYIPLSGSSSITGNLEFSNSGTTSRGIIGTIGDNDYWRIIGGVTATNAGYLEIATADDGSEPIYVRQYSSGKFVTLARTATLLDASGNTSFPGSVTASSFVGKATSATSASTSDNVSGENGTVNSDRHIWFSDSVSETKRNYSDSFKYNPATDTLTVGTLNGNISSANYATSSGYASKSSTADYATSAGMSNGNFWIKEGNNIILRPGNSAYTAGIGYDTSGNECIALWAKNSVTRLRWYAGKDMSTMSTGSMMDITPDFEVSKASGSVIGYLAGNTILHSGNYSSYALPKSGGTMTGGLTISAGWSNGLQINAGSGSGIHIYGDNEGGNIRLYAPSSADRYWEIDANDGNIRFYTTPVSTWSYSSPLYIASSGIFVPKINNFKINSASASTGVFNGIPVIASDGVMEVGRYIDFHYDDATSTDKTLRIQTLSDGTFYSSGSIKSDYHIYATGDFIIGSGHCIYPDAGSTTYGLKFTYFTNPILQIIPNNDANTYLGHASYRFAEVRSVNMYISAGTAVTSDRRYKNTINELDEELSNNFIMSLKPSSFKYNDGESGRLHYGLIAQDVEDAMKANNISSQEFAGLIIEKLTEPIERDVLDNDGNIVINEETGEPQKESYLKETGEIKYDLRYEEFIAPMIKVIQKQNREIEDLRNEISELKELITQT